MFDSLVKPILLYSCQVITPHLLTTKKLSLNDTNNEKYFKTISSDIYEQFHIKFLKWCLGVHRKSSNIGVWGETGRYPLIFHALKLSADYFTRVANLDNSLLVKKAFIEQENLNLEWFNANKQISDKFGTGDFIRSSTNINVNLKEQFVQYWVYCKSNSPKLEFYHTLKENFKRENYLQIRNIRHRSALTKMRISSHNLQIERGRYEINPITKLSKPRNERICAHCNLILGARVIEDEFHALIDCQLYNKQRLKLTNSTTKPLKDVLYYSTDIIEISHLGKLCYDIQEIHEAFRKFVDDKSDNSSDNENVSN